MDFRLHRAVPVLTLVLAGLLHTPAQAAIWAWDYAGAGISASGSLTTADTPDGGGFYAVTGISGSRNGVGITGLQPTGTPIPGNEPFAVDNLLSLSAPHLTGDGIGFSLADGTYVNVFFASFLATPGHLEFYSAAPFVPGTPGPEDSELPVVFHATMAVPEPAAGLLVALGLAAAAVGRRRAARSLR